MRWKWTLILSFGNLLLAVGMSTVGLREYERFHVTHPGAFYHGNIYYEPAPQLLSYCLNAPPFAVSNVFLNFVMIHHILPQSWLDVHCFYFVRYEFYVGLFLFWWWVGWQVDMKLASRNSGRAWRIVESSLGIVLALLLLADGSIGAWNDHAIQAIAWAMVAWGAILLYYFLLRFRPFIVRPAQQES